MRKKGSPSRSLLVAASLILAGCTPVARPLDDNEKIVRSVLALLVSDGQPVCIDDHTSGQALSIFREMTLAPRPSRQPLRWYPPKPLRPPIKIDANDVTEPQARRDPLPQLEQYLLRGAAWRLSAPIGDAEKDVAIRAAWIPKGVFARWWPMNRFRRDCSPLFEISDPVRGRDFAFVSVRAGHWGTLYALKPDQGEWTAVGEWSRWIY